MTLCVRYLLFSSRLTNQLRCSLVGYLVKGNFRKTGIGFILTFIKTVIVLHATTNHYFGRLILLKLLQSYNFNITSVSFENSY